MKTVYWILTAGLMLVLMAYSSTRDASGVCQLPQSTTYRVFR